MIRTKMTTADPHASPADTTGLAATVAPASVEVTPRFLRVGDGYATSMIVTGYPAEVGRSWLEPLLSWPGRLDLALYIDPVPSPIAASRLKTQRAKLESSRRSDLGRGRLADPAVEAAADDAADLAARVARGAAKLFRVGLYLTVHARTEAELAEAVVQVRAAAASTLLEVQPATWRHLAGWTTTLPLGHDALRMRRTMDTAALAQAFPLNSPDLPAPLPGEDAPTGGVLYGINPDSSGIVWWDRWAQDNYHSVVLARSGAGKSYMVKLDLLRNLYQQVRCSVIDPDDEYLRLADAVGGTVVQLGAAGVRINPLDLPVGDPRPDVLTRRALFLHTFIAVLLGGGHDDSTAMSAAEKAALDRAILAVYRQAGITADPATHRRPAPLLRDLCAQLRADADPAGVQLATRLAPWVEGNFRALFDAPTTHRPDGHLIVWSLRQLPDELRTIGTLLALDAIWRSVDAPSPDGRLPRRLIVVDEAWLLMRSGEGAKFLYRLAKAGRKRHAGLTVITQDAADLLSTDLGRAVVANAATQILLRQASQSIDAVGEAFGLTSGERRILLADRKGSGLIIAGTARTRFEVIASKAEHLLATTNPADLIDDDEEVDL